MLVRDFDYDLPDELVAQHPSERGASRLMVLDRDGGIEHRHIDELPEILRTGDLLVVNDTAVIPARLHGRRRPGGGRTELLLAEKVGEREWDVLGKPGRKLRPGTVLDLADDLSAEVVERQRDGRIRVRFSAPVEAHLDELGEVPLPPYISRPPTARDRDRYQTVYAERPGAIAAPTAGLHFSEELLVRLERAGIGCTSVTLHIGIGTFKPVTAALAHEHEMDAEWYEIPETTVTAIEVTWARGDRVVAVGTTTVRALEGAVAKQGRLVAGSGRTDLFIRPGHEFRVVDALLTNFHLPRSTLLMLVCAFAGRERVLAAYEEAIERRYRFYSYGDAMLVL